MYIYFLYLPLLPYPEYRKSKWCTGAQQKRHGGHETSVPK